MSIQWAEVKVIRETNWLPTTPGDEIEGVWEGTRQVDQFGTEVDVILSGDRRYLVDGIRDQVKLGEFAENDLIKVVFINCVNNNGRVYSVFYDTNRRNVYP